MRNLVRGVAVLVSLTLAASSAQAEPVAVLAALKGKVMVTPGRPGGHRPAPATFGSPLESGDRISAGPRSSATLFFNDGNVIELGPGSSMTIGGRVAAGTAAGRERLPREAFLSVRNFRLAGSRERGLVAVPALRSGGDAALPEPLSPRQTDLLAARPTFTWRAVPGAVRYVVTLSGMEGERWTRESQGTTLAFPADAGELVEGEYVWDVQAHTADTPAGKASATFRVVAVIEADAVRGVVRRMHQSVGGAGNPAARYLAGAYLFERGFLADAAEQFAALAELEPESSAPQEALGDVYRTVGLLDLAAAAYQKAKGLSTAR